MSIERAEKALGDAAHEHVLYSSIHQHRGRDTWADLKAAAVVYASIAGVGLSDEDKEALRWLHDEMKDEFGSSGLGKRAFEAIARLLEGKS